MIVPDVNLLVYAYNESAPLHRQARSWWEGLLSKERTVGLPWAVAMGFVRLVTHPRVLVRPVAPPVALDCVESWLARPGVVALDTGPRHLALVRELTASTGVAGSLTTALHLAALALEYQAELHSNDADFGRFSGLRWRNPLKREA